MRDTKMIFLGVGEVGVDPEASPGNGPYYVIHYASGYDAVGFETEDEALEELRYLRDTYVPETAGA
jgi:hypothetical protein